MSHGEVFPELGRCWGVISLLLQNYRMKGFGLGDVKVSRLHLGGGCVSQVLGDGFSIL